MQSFEDAEVQVRLNHQDLNGHVGFELFLGSKLSLLVHIIITWRDNNYASLAAKLAGREC